jgi:hypothetical protein
VFTTRTACSSNARNGRGKNDFTRWRSPVVLVAKAIAHFLQSSAGKGLVDVPLGARIGCDVDSSRGRFRDVRPLRALMR